MGWGKSWGSWHTGPAAMTACPQDGLFHTAQEAVDLNSKNSEYAAAVRHARHKQWIGHEKAPGSP